MRVVLLCREFFRGIREYIYIVKFFWKGRQKRKKGCEIWKLYELNLICLLGTPQVVEFLLPIAVLVNGHVT